MDDIEGRAIELYDSEVDVQASPYWDELSPVDKQSYIDRVQRGEGGDTMECMHHDYGDDYDNVHVPHWHVVAFINGCLNDYVSLPCDTIAEAREELAQYVEDGGMQPLRPCERIGRDAYANGHYCITIEDCFEDCSGDEWQY